MVGAQREQLDQDTAQPGVQGVTKARKVWGYILKTRPGRLGLPMSLTRYARRTSAMCSGSR